MVPSLVHDVNYCTSRDFLRVLPTMRSMQGKNEHLTLLSSQLPGPPHSVTRLLAKHFLGGPRSPYGPPTFVVSMAPLSCAMPRNALTTKSHDCRLSFLPENTVFCRLQRYHKVSNRKSSISQWGSTLFMLSAQIHSFTKTTKVCRGSGF